MIWSLAGSATTAQTPAATGSLAKTTLVEPPIPLLPATLGRLKRVDENPGNESGEVSPADQPVLAEDGLRRFAGSSYSSDGKDLLPPVTIAVYQFADASGATAAYDYFRRPGMRPQKLGDSAVASTNELLLRTGVNVVDEKLRTGPGEGIALAKALIETLPKGFGPAALPPPLPMFLPAKGLEAESVKYAFGPASYQATGGVLEAQTVGFEKSAETVTAKYQDGGTLTLLEYPTPEIAGERGRVIEAELKQRGNAAGTVKVRREGPLLMVTTGAWKPAEAASLIDGIHLRDQLTWNRDMPPEFHTELQRTYSLLTSIAILCGVGGLAAVVLGLFLGGGRALVRVMQGKPAASEPEFLRIDLRGQSKKRFGLPDS